MKGLIGKYNRNRKFIWLIIGICIGIYAIIHIINVFLGQGLYEKDNNIGNITNNGFYDTSYSVISSEQIKEEYKDSINKTIKEFIDSCNNNQVEKAYNMLSKECKEVLYPSIETFEEEYIKEVFPSKKTYKMQSWITNGNKYTYRIELLEDILSNGKSTNSKKIDYYTVIKEEDNYYLNIDGFVEKNELNKYNQNELMKITITSEEVFVNYVYTNIKVENKTNGQILIDEGSQGDSVYLKDMNDVGYASFLYEEPEENLIVRKKSEKEFKIKFDKEYSTTIKIKEIGFTDVVVNYRSQNQKANQKLIIEVFNDKK